MNTTWILVANASEAHLYFINGLHNGGLHHLHDFNHPESRKKGAELASDRPGHYQSRGAGHGALIEATSPKEVEAQRFAHELADYLDKGRQDHSYEKLILVTPPHFQGLLKKRLNSHVHEKINKTIKKDYTKIPARELLSQITSHF